ncbi:MAG: acetyltransferase [Nitrospirae bacterium]|nr:acetyltransferase [Nitrospirota bacterium]
MAALRILILGAGAQAKYAIDIFKLTERNEMVGVIDLEDRKDGRAEALLGISILGGLELLKRGKLGATHALIAHRDNLKKAGLAEQCKRIGLRSATAIHPGASISPFSKIGEGSIINAGAVIQPNAVIGRHVMVHANVVVDHDSTVGDFANLAPGCTLAGHVQVGRMAYVYTGAVVGPNLRIGDRCEIGAGAVVLKDVPKGWRVAGNPAKRI